MKKSIFTSKTAILLISIFILQVCFVSALTITSTTSNPTEVQPGEKISLTLNIENNLNEDIDNVVVSLGLTSTTKVIPFAPYQSSNEYRIDEILEGDKEKARFDLISFSDSESGTYTIPVKVSYNLENGTLISNQEIGLVTAIINAKPSIELSLENNALIKGTNGKISIKIINSGMGESKFLSIKLNPINGIKMISSNKVYIGSVESNDFDSADFDVFININSLSTINLPVELTYTDSMNNQITENKIVTLTTYTQEEAIKMGLVKKNNSLLIILSLILVVIVFLFYKRSRKKKKNKQDNLQ